MTTDAVSEPEPKRRSARSQETRERIVKAALKAFSESGFEGASTRQIAALAGESQGLITYHFSTKENLWKAAVDSLFGPFIEELNARKAALADADIRTQLRLLLIFFVRHAASHPEQNRLMMQEAQSETPRMRYIAETYLKDQYEFACEILRQAIDAGILPPAPHIHYFYIVVGACSRLFTATSECKYLTGDDAMSPAMIEAHAEAVANLILR
ncbi:MAG: TetR/AcrR family transcriptional regulator [Myxococcota bacterium]